MRDVGYQFSLFVGYMLALIAFRRYVEAGEARRKETERRRREALEREWRVGIPYDPGPEDAGARRLNDLR